MSYLTNPLTVLAFKEALKALDPLYESHTFLVGVSGGVDSMVLASLCLKAGLKFEIAHVNYHLREEASIQDQKTVEAFCQANAIPLHLYEVGVADHKPGGSIQLWARTLRYDFFKRIQQQAKLSRLLTAHHMEDQLETFIINLSRGSGLKGLSGIPSKENGILRPLLQFSKTQVYDFAQLHQIDFREDLSNESDFYLRNRIRHHIVPRLKETSPNFLENFQKSISILSSIQEHLSQGASDFLNNHKTTDQNGNTQTLDLRALRLESQAIQHEVLKSVGFRSIEQISSVFSCISGSQFQLEDSTAYVNRNELILTRELSSDSETTFEFDITDLQGNILVPSVLKAQFTDFSPLEWQFDSDKIQFPLRIRHKKPGDIFYPIGMIGKKKITKFFKDEKISILAKSNIWILCDSQNQILGVLPFRQDRRFVAQNCTSKKYSFLIECEI